MHDNHEQIDHKIYDISTDEIQMGKNKLGKLCPWGRKLEKLLHLHQFICQYKWYFKSMSNQMSKRQKI